MLHGDVTVGHSGVDAGRRDVGLAEDPLGREHVASAEQVLAREEVAGRASPEGEPPAKNRGTAPGNRFVRPAGSACVLLR